MIDRITSVITFNQRNERAVQDARRFTNGIVETLPALCDVTFSSTYDGETAVFTIDMDADYMDDFNWAVGMLAGTPEGNGILHYLGVGVSERRQRPMPMEGEDGNVN